MYVFIASPAKQDGYHFEAQPKVQPNKDKLFYYFVALSVCVCVYVRKLKITLFNFQSFFFSSVWLNALPDRVTIERNANKPNKKKMAWLSLQRYALHSTVMI